jgi:hypothetical protein
MIKTHLDARERAKELAFKHRDIGSIARRLEEEELGELIDRYELESVVAEVRTIRRMIPERRGSGGVRAVGIIAVIMGLVVIGMGAEIFGSVALILGLVLILNPSQAKSGF